MSRHWQRISTSLGLTAYLLAVTCGDWLHTHHHGEVLPCGVETAGCHEEEGADHEYCDHEHCGHGVPASPHDDDCSICRFQAQQPLAAQAVLVETCLGAVL